MATERHTPKSNVEPKPTGTVLVVEDDPQLVETYASILAADHAVRRATTGAEALDRIGPTVDVVLLDRQLPDRPGDEVLEAIREAAYNCLVAMVTAVEPTVDVVDLPFDDYLVKPVDGDVLCGAVETLLLRSRYSDGVQELLAVTSKLVALETRLDRHELAAHEEYEALRERRARLEAANRERLDELRDPDDPGLAFRDVLGPT